MKCQPLGRVNLLSPIWTHPILAADSDGMEKREGEGTGAHYRYKRELQNKSLEVRPKSRLKVPRSSVGRKI